GCPRVSECWRTASVVQGTVIAKLAADDAGPADRAVDIDGVTVGGRPDRRGERMVREAALCHHAELDSRRRRTRLDHWPCHPFGREVSAAGQAPHNGAASVGAQQVGGTGGTGGLGGEATATIPVTPGETLQVNVGGVGADSVGVALSTAGGAGGF